MRAGVDFMVMPFRHSDYIDFTTGAVKVQPMELISRWGPRENQPIEMMLIVFECRVDVWQFGPAVEMLKLMEAAKDTSVWAHAGYTLLASCFHYFEMIGKTLNPASNGRRSSGVDFNHGFCDVYPTFAAAVNARTDKALPHVAQFRDRIRNGMYHMGYTKSRLFIHHAPNKWPDDFMIVTEDGQNNYLVNPHNLTRTIVEHFPGLMARLRNPDFALDSLRRKFVEFYVAFHAANGTT